MADYASKNNGELLAALEQAGRVPEPSLIAACMERGHELVPGLLELFACGLTDDEEYPDWPNDDPRWYVPIHAGRLLMALQATEALPVLRRYLRIDEFDWLVEWFEGETLAYFGPEAVPGLRAILEDEDVVVWGRWIATDSLGALAGTYAHVRDAVIEALHDALPDLRDDTLDLPEEPDEDSIILWTALLLDLAYLGDESARPVAHALHDAGLVDESMYGGRDDFDRILESDDERHRFEEVGDYDIVAEYRRWKSSELAEQRREERQRKAQVDESKIGRNDRITIRDPATGEKIENIKYKHAQKKLTAGWEIVAV